MTEMKKIIWLCVIFTLSYKITYSQDMPAIPSMKERATIIDRWIEERVRTILPMLMQREKIDMWIIIAREYNEDPVIETMLPANWLAARRRTILVIYDPGNSQELETLAVARYDVGTVFKKSWDKEEQPIQWQRLIESGTGITGISHGS